MRVQIMLLFISLLSTESRAEDQAIKELFVKYDQVMLQKKLELVDDVFTKKFFSENGGRSGYLSRIKELRAPAGAATDLTWKKGVRKRIFFAQLKDKNSQDKTEQHPQFVIVSEDGKLKIDGTISDEN
ncbi:MAG TPA: hypothetical protein VNJ01_15330 [Bacteriovoracaceae bacterium]|nr:hypothetical protein [Bacteriovoracaceae bacterium]